MESPVYSLRSSFNKTVKYKRKYIRNRTVKQKIHRKFLGTTVGAIIIYKEVEFKGFPELA